MKENNDVNNDNNEEQEEIKNDSIKKEKKIK